MSTKLVGFALETQGLTSAQKLTLIALADMTNAQTGACFPSIPRIQVVSEIRSERHQRTVIDQLVDLGYLEKIPRPGTSSRYVVFLPHPGSESLPTPAVPRLSGQPEPRLSGQPTNQKEPDRTAVNDDTSVDNSTPHHYCRPAKAFVDHPRNTCAECAQPKQGEAQQ